MQIAGANQSINPIHFIQKGFFVAFRETSGYDQFLPGFLLLHGGPNSFKGFLTGIMNEPTGVDQDELCLIHFFGLDEVTLAHKLGVTLGINQIFSAAKADNVKGVFRYFFHGFGVWVGCAWAGVTSGLLVASAGWVWRIWLLKLVIPMAVKLTLASVPMGPKP